MPKRSVKQQIVVFSVLFVSVLCVSAQNIFSHLGNKDTSAKAVVKVHQDQRIESLVYGVKKKPVIQTQTFENSVGTVEPLAVVNTVEVPGYRVQVYTSNIQKTAKSEAFRIEEEFQQLLPNVPVYVSYHSPFWKVRAGNCRTMPEAQQLKYEIGEAYPQVKRDLYVVRDKIKVPAKQ